MTTNQKELVSDEELDQMIWKLERDGMTPKMLSLMRELRELRKAKCDGRDQFEEWFKFHHGEEGSIVTLHRANGGANYADPHVDLAWIAWKDSRAAMQLSGNSEQLEPVSNRDELPAKCWCHTCRPVTMNDMRFVVCPECGNKRCPRANNHRNACTGSNAPGQDGSAYPPAPNFREITETSTNEHVRREYRASDEQVVLREYRTNHSVWIQCSKQAYESRKAEGCEVRELYERPQAGNSPATPDVISESGEDCWACGEYFTYEQHSECDGYYPHCGSPVDLDDDEDQSFKVVPTEPTEEMISNAWREAVGKCDHETIKRIYATMLAAAPKEVG